MPIQNFSIEYKINCKIDGRKSRLLDGPTSEDGGFNLTIYQRSEGKKITALIVAGIVRDDGMLALEILRNNNTLMISSVLERLITKR